MSFQDDLDTDRATFFDATGAGFAVSVTHTAARTGAATVLNAVSEEQIYSVYDPQQNTKLYWSTASVTPAAGDRVSFAGFTWHVLNVRELDAVYEVSIFRQDERQ